MTTDIIITIIVFAILLIYQLYSEDELLVKDLLAIIIFAVLWPIFLLCLLIWTLELAMAGELTTTVKKVLNYPLIKI